MYNVATHYFVMFGAESVNHSTYMCDLIISTNCITPIYCNLILLSNEQILNLICSKFILYHVCNLDMPIRVFAGIKIIHCVHSGN